MADAKQQQQNEGLEGQSFRNEALTGSGTILDDGTYGEPQPDPTEVRGLGPDKTSGGRTVLGGGLGDAESERTGPSTSEDPATAKQASGTSSTASRKARSADGDGSK